MKKVLIIVIVLPFLIATAFFYNRYRQNLATIIPYPFVFRSMPEVIKHEAPILIIGDRMASRLETFKDQLAKKISEHIPGTVKIQYITSEGQNIHRSLEAFKKMDRLPLLTIILSNTDEGFEELIKPQSLKNTLSNIDLYNDINIQSLLIVFPEMSRLIYKNIDYQILGPTIRPRKNEVSADLHFYHQKALFKLYEASLNNFFEYAKKRASFVLPVTTPINLKRPPKKSCYGSLDKEGRLELKTVIESFQKKDFKSAFNLSRELVLLYPNNAQVLYLHSQILYRLNDYTQAHRYGEKAVAMDCGLKTGNPIYNEIMKKAASKHNFPTFDYHSYLADESTNNHVFIEGIYPQDFYLGKLTDVLAIKIQKLLKLDR